MLSVQLVKCHEKDDPIKDLTSAAACAMRATVHGVTKCALSQLVFAKDMILRSTVEANGELGRQRREAAISQNNARENKKRVAHNYKRGDWVLILSRHLDPKLHLHPGPFKVLSYSMKRVQALFTFRGRTMLSLSTSRMCIPIMGLRTVRSHSH